MMVPNHIENCLPGQLLDVRSSPALARGQCACTAGHASGYVVRMSVTRGDVFGLMIRSGL
jgi:hypothetical protein